MKKSFSLLELCLSLCILGILLSFSKIFFEKDRLYEGAFQIVNDLRYTRSLALFQSAFRPENLSVASDEWYKSRWQLYFNKSNFTNQNLSYSIFLDKNGDGNANLGKINVNVDREMAVDILNPNKLMNYGQSGVLDARIESDRMKMTSRFNIEKNFGIIKAELRAACSGTSTKIIFDEFNHLYSPLKNAISAFDKNLSLNDKCVIRLSNKNKSICIVVQTLSGLAYIPEFNSHNVQLIEYKNKITPCEKI
ncbi:prepilin-type cleavage/methylation domain-containing protein [Campylobacter sp. LR286c]|uniref:prepilin-type cleavage/methylation domain-containing protein n=1 Tax=Campylobacter sp. LR286c TaxID=2593545 RepID=UPI0012382D27|nr:prepilin-type cleavage/methylation domain-containing protein [Campylobacter sp. LR286c]KAA6229099.1 prepilin-type cleavage/methylation domain-containing protein [Campylobacter sp. LR286c]